MIPNIRHHPDDIHRQGLLRRIGCVWQRISCSLFIIGLLSLIWFAFRTGTKPSRVAYPCQQAAAAQSSLWLAAYIFPLGIAAKHRANWIRFSVLLLPLVMIASIVWGSGIWDGGTPSLASQSQIVELDLQVKLATGNPASSIFAVKGATGKDGDLSSLMDLMGSKGTPFYKSSIPGKIQGPTGLIAREDTLIIKVNSQWDERGGTNTDLVKYLIETITHHPDGFIGEIIVADNGQAQYGLSGKGGSLDYSRNNAEDITQSIQKVVNSFTGTYRVSTYLWDTITTKKVSEFDEGDLEDGYVLNAAANPQTGIIISYPKFKTQFGSYISFKKGIWNTQTRSYNSGILKVINVPVLKSHSGYGVTASIKHYMGVGSDKLTSQAGSRMHNTVGNGGMGSEMVETRFPVLNILDAIWVNATPGRGPGTSYAAATRAGTIAASTDPAALDYWAAKNILVQIATKIGNTNVNSIDPDNTGEKSFGRWLRLSMQEINNAGYQATVDEAKMNVYISSINQETASLTPSPLPATITSPISSPLLTGAASTQSNPPLSTLASPDAPANQPGQRWFNILFRIVIPLVIAGVFIGIISYRMRKKQ